MKECEDNQHSSDSEDSLCAERRLRFMRKVLKSNQHLTWDISYWIQDEIDCILQDQDMTLQSQDSEPTDTEPREGNMIHCPVCNLPWNTGLFSARLVASLKTKGAKKMNNNPKLKLSSDEKRQLEAYNKDQALFKLICQMCKRRDYSYVNRIQKHKMARAMSEAVFTTEPLAVNKKRKREKNAGLCLPEKPVEKKAKKKEEKVKILTLEEKIAESIARILGKKEKKKKKKKARSEQEEKESPEDVMTLGPQSIEDQKKIWKEEYRKKAKHSEKKAKKMLQEQSNNNKKNQPEEQKPVKKVHTNSKRTMAGMAQALMQPDEKSNLNKFLGTLF